MLLLKNHEFRVTTVLQRGSVMIPRPPGDLEERLPGADRRPKGAARAGPR